MKYEFVEIDEYTTKLKYKDKEFTFKKTVALLEKIQSTNLEAKANMMKFLKSRGETANDYIVTKTEGSKVIEDKSNLVELETTFLGEARNKMYDDICKEFTGMTYAALMVDIGISVANTKEALEEIKDFTTGLSKAVMKVDKDTPREN